ncbi:tetratricopeptide repeat protein [Desulfovulcanus sp.]
MNYRLMVSFLVFVLMGHFCLAADVNDLLFKGADYHYRGKLTEAEQAFRQVLKFEPENEFALNQLGLIYAKQEKFDLAYNQFAKVVRISPDNTFARIWLGVLLLKDNKVDQAFKEFQKTLAVDSNNANAYYFIGVIYAVEHNLKQSIKYLRKAQSVGSDDPETHFRLANAFAGLDMVYNAQLEYERALELNPKFTNALNALGWLYYNQGETEKAITAWKKALRLNNSDPEARHNLAKVYNDLALSSFKAGDKSRAKKLWLETLRFEPKNKSAKYYLRKIG